MKIGQCFLKLQRKMSGMFFLRHTVDALLNRKMHKNPFTTRVLRFPSWTEEAYF